MIKVCQKKIDKVFERCEHQQDVLIELYKLVFPDWDFIEKIEDWPTCGKELWEYICKKFIRFDKTFHPDVFAGGAWMNNGFSWNENMDGWSINKHTCSVFYKTEKIQIQKINVSFPEVKVNHIKF